MQKLVKYNKYEIDKLKPELSDGWLVKHMIFTNEWIIILEKETRKEKLEALNNISNG
jgi:hypothetical protein